MINNHSPTAEKIALFRSLFRGREDVYPRHFESLKIGRIGGGRRKPTGLIDIATIQSLTRKKVVDECVSQYGHVIIDECHHLPAESFEEVVRQVKGKFITGLSATVARKDGRHPIIMMRCGPIRYRVNAKEQAITRPFDHLVFVHSTAFFPEKSTNEDLRIQFQELYKELINDTNRNQLICNDIISAIKDGRSPIVLTERNEHLDYLSETLETKIKHVIVLRGGMSQKAIREMMDSIKEIPENEERVLISTGRFIGEGFDDARLDTLFLTLPVSWQGTLAQYIGRLHRLYDSKKEIQVYDYADLRVPMLERMFNKRCKAYETIGYKILSPASALAGWPANIPLPVDSLWKAEYATSVKRLTRDGVDEQLAYLFAQVSIENKTGVERARSSAEAFLYCRLESLPETKGRFQLNVDLPIPFSWQGSMEVDLLCADARVVIEIDGAQHFSDLNAYRRDRRKDMLLQENGYMVLRFLAEDIGKYFSDILDFILRAISTRKCSKLDFKCNS